LYTHINGTPNYNGVNEDILTGYRQEYFDRTLTHEMVHALMDANIVSVGELPASIKEGLAELIHGIDDVRTANIYHVFEKHTANEWWSKLLTPIKIYDSPSDSYHSDTYAQYSTSTN